MNLKREISPPVAIAVIVVVVVALIVGYVAMTGGFRRGDLTPQQAGAGKPMLPGQIPWQNTGPVQAPITPQGATR
ncbi:MAG: hypothetical protein RMM06_09390 [Armatimonadota bacterium]|nr:hypothetical protein [bacterium]MCS7309695.1 hypothetical protein [Armatimonadota bacterium]MDW8290926.1 hypothetical protein [Armatimonadota bacterium]